MACHGCNKVFSFSFKQIYYMILMYFILICHGLIECEGKDAYKNYSPDKFRIYSDIFKEAMKGFDLKFKLHEAAKNLSSSFTTNSIEELGLDTVKSIFHSIQAEKESTHLKNNEEDSLKKLTKKIDVHLSLVVKAINESVESIQNFGNDNTKIHFDCIGAFKNITNMQCESVHKNASIDFNILCPPLFKISDVFLHHQRTIASIKDEYFLPSGDDYKKCVRKPSCLSISNQYCQPLNDPYFEQIYLKSIDHNPKHIVILIDHGNSPGLDIHNVAKSLAKYIVLSLGFKDKVCVVGISETAVSICNQRRFCQFDKLNLLKFIDSLNVSAGATNHSLGFDVSFNLINNVIQNGTSDINAHIIYISRGVYSSILDIERVMKIIALKQGNTFPSIIINTCGLFNEYLLISYERTFLLEIAHQNFFKYNISYTHPLLPGVFEELYVSDDFQVDIGPTVRKLMGSMDIEVDVADKINFFLPNLEEIRSNPTIAISKVVNIRDHGIIGVVAVQAFLEDIFEELIYFNGKIGSYAFLMNIEGEILLHPSLRSNNYYIDQTWVIDFSSVEIIKDVFIVKSKILTENSGKLQAIKENDENHVIEYSWLRVANSPYIVVIASEMRDGLIGPKEYYHSPLNETAEFDLVFNNIDYHATKEYTRCRYLNDITTLDLGSLFLSASCFQLPHKYLVSWKNSTYFNIPIFMAYIKDKTDLLANPGLKIGIREEIIYLSNIIPIWKNRFVNSPNKKYILRRYIATSSGVMIMYPGMQLLHRYDPSLSAWFTDAVKNLNSLTFTYNYEDPSNEKYVVTISQAFMLNPTDTIVVVAMDVTFGYFSIELMNIVPECENENNNIRCFLMDYRGYLLSHPSFWNHKLIDLNDKPPIEGQHITYKESLVANDILNDKVLIQKYVCSDLTSGTIQRHYQFNTNVKSKVYSNVIAGEQCIQYQLIYIPNTTVFLGLINTACENSAFCPCSRIDRICLNCDRMEKTSCECPCECSSDFKCYSEHNQSSIPLCTNSVGYYNRYSFASYAKSNIHQNDVNAVASCSVSECHNYQTRRSCVGSIGCEWCSLKSDGITPFDIPFCTVQQFCVNGVVGLNFFDDEPMEESSFANISILKSTPFSRIKCGQLILFFVTSVLILTGVLYCYLKRRTICQDNQGYESQCNLERNNANVILEEPPTEPHSRLLQSVQEVGVALLTPLSPYSVNTEYRRPPPAASDNGYSTMSPAEEPDSESLETEDVHSESQPTQTLLSHHVLVPVTVHQVMDAQ